MHDLPQNGTILAFDFGIKRIGIALGELSIQTAHPLEVIHQEDNASRFGRITALIEEWHPCLLVVGLPYDLEGNEQEMTRRAKRFQHQLEGRYRLPVETVDERFTSKAAESSLYHQGLNSKKQRPVLDAVAAYHILTTWYEKNQTRLQR